LSANRERQTDCREQSNCQCVECFMHPDIVTLTRFVRKLRVLTTDLARPVSSACSRFLASVVPNFGAARAG
jgi:hypothetical protein